MKSELLLATVNDELKIVNREKMSERLKKDEKFEYENGGEIIFPV